MVIFLVLLCGAFLFFAVGTLLFSKSAIHEIDGSLLLLVAILCLITASILAELRRIRRAVTDLRKTDEDEDADEDETDKENEEDAAAGRERRRQQRITEV